MCETQRSLYFENSGIPDRQCWIHASSYSMIYSYKALNMYYVAKYEHHYMWTCKGGQLLWMIYVALEWRQVYVTAFQIHLQTNKNSALLQWDSITAVIGGSSSQRASNVECVFISWRHYAAMSASTNTPAVRQVITEIYNNFGIYRNINASSRIYRTNRSIVFWSCGYSTESLIWLWNAWAWHSLR